MSKKHHKLRSSAYGRNPGESWQDYFARIMADGTRLARENRIANERGDYRGKRHNQTRAKVCGLDEVPA